MNTVFQTSIPHRDPLSIHLYSKAPLLPPSNPVVGTSAPYAHVKKEHNNNGPIKKRKKKIYAPLDDDEGKSNIPLYIDKTLGK